MTYADVVKIVSPKNIISDSEMTMQDSGKDKVNCDGQNHIKMSPSDHSLNQNNSVYQLKQLNKTDIGFSDSDPMYLWRTKNRNILYLNIILI